MDLRDFLQQVVQYNASDLHLTEGMPPIFRIDGELRPAQMEPLTREDTRRLIYGVLNDTQKVKFEETHELDLSLYIPGISRFRVNVHQQRGSVEAAFRVVLLQIRTIGELGLPPVVGYLAERPNGLVICTGPTGTGKTTTLAGMVEHINQRRRCMIITIEDPIEYLFKNDKAVIKQREVGADTPSFGSALKYVLRQDPDVILVGEMRDLETIATAITAAETGHLVMSTLHTPDAAQTIDRIIDVFPPHQQQQIQIQLASCLQGIIAQVLIPRADGNGRIVSTEVLVATEAIRSCVRDHRTAQIPTMLQTGSQYGMMTMDRSLKNLYMRGLITYEEAMLRARHPQDFANL